MTNDLLRSHVTGAAFHLTLGKTHIAALVHLEEVIGAGKTSGEAVRDRKPPGLGNFVTGASGLVARGLVTHLVPLDGSYANDKLFSSFWQITPAGRLVLELLREAGIWQEYATNPAAHDGQAA